MQEYVFDTRGGKKKQEKKTQPFPPIFIPITQFQHQQMHTFVFQFLLPDWDQLRWLLFTCRFLP
jgi:hypothetical protein